MCWGALQNDLLCELVHPSRGTQVILQDDIHAHCEHSSPPNSALRGEFLDQNSSHNCICGSPPLTAGVILHTGHERHVVTETRVITVDVSHDSGNLLSLPNMPLVSLGSNQNRTTLFRLPHYLKTLDWTLRWGSVFFKSREQNNVRRFGRGLAGLFSQQILLNLIKRCSDQHTEIFMDKTNMRRFESVFTNRITSSWHQKSKISKRIVLIDNTSLI